MLRMLRYIALPHCLFDHLDGLIVVLVLFRRKCDKIKDDAVSDKDPIKLPQPSTCPEKALLLITLATAST